MLLVSPAACTNTHPHVIRVAFIIACMKLKRQKKLKQKNNPKNVSFNNRRRRRRYRRHRCLTTCTRKREPVLVFLLFFFRLMRHIDTTNQLKNIDYLLLPARIWINIKIRKKRNHAYQTQKKSNFIRKKIQRHDEDYTIHDDVMWTPFSDDDDASHKKLINI